MRKVGQNAVRNCCGSRKMYLNDGLRPSHQTRQVFQPNRGWAMNSSTRSISVVSALFAVLLSISPGTLAARDADFASPRFAAAHTAKQQCINTCRARYRDCLSLKQIPSSECRGIYQDCTGDTCNAGRAGRPFWPGFPS